MTGATALGEEAVDMVIELSNTAAVAKCCVGADIEETSRGTPVTGSLKSTSWRRSTSSFPNNLKEEFER